MPMLRPARLRGLFMWPRRRGEGNAGLVLGMVLVIILCVAVIGGSVFFIVTSWPDGTEEPQWEGAAPAPGPAPPGGPPGQVQGSGPVGGGPQVGQVAPDIDGEDIDGVKFKLSDYRGKVVMLDFWGHW